VRAGGTFSGLTHVVAMAALLFGWPAFTLIFERTDDIDEPIDVLVYGKNEEFNAAFRTGNLVEKKAEDTESLETKGGIDPDDISPTDTTGDAGFTSQGNTDTNRTAVGRTDIARIGAPDSPERVRSRMPDDPAGVRTPSTNEDDIPRPADQPSPDRAMREIVINVQVARLADLSAPQSEQRAMTATLAAVPVQAVPPPREVAGRDMPPASRSDTVAAEQPSPPAPPPTPAAATAATTSDDRAATPSSVPRLQIDAPVATQATGPVAVLSGIQPGTAGEEAAADRQAVASAATQAPAATPARAIPAAAATVAAGEPGATPPAPRTTTAPPKSLAQVAETEARTGGDVPRPASRSDVADAGVPTPAAGTPAVAAAESAQAAGGAGPAAPSLASSQGQPQASPRQALAEAAASKLRDAPPTIVKVDAPRTPLDPASPDRPAAAAVAEERPVASPAVLTQPAPEAVTAPPRAAEVARDERAQAVPPAQRAETPPSPPATTPTDPLSRLAALAAGDDEVLRRLLQPELRPLPGPAPDGREARSTGELPLSGAETPTPDAAQATRGTSARTEAVLREAAAAGNGKAALILAKRALRGEATTVPRGEIESLLRRAAERGEVEAQLLLAVVKAKGIVVAQDRIEAHALLKVAAIATGALSELATALPPDPARPKSPEARAVEAALAQVERQMSIEEVVKSQTVENAYRHALRVAPRGTQAGRFGTAANTEMLEAAAAGSTATLAELLARGADIEGRDTTGRTAIINAAWRGRVEAIELLVALGANFDVVDTGGLTAVQWAASNGHTEAVERLVAAGASIDAADNDGRTALMRAAWNGHAETVAALLRAGASTRRTDAKGESARTYAQRSGNRDVVRLLGDGT